MQEGPETEADTRVLRTSGLRGLMPRACLACKIAPAARIPDLHRACRRRSRASSSSADITCRSLAPMAPLWSSSWPSSSVEPIRRYERATPGELLHIDTKRLGRIHVLGDRITGDRAKNRNRGIGWEAVHLAIYNSVLSP